MFTKTNTNQFLIALLVIFTAACGGDNAASDRADNTAADDSSSVKGTPVSVRQIMPSTFRHFINVQGSVESDKTIMISPKVSGTVEGVMVNAGEQVQRDQALAQLDGQVTQSRINELKTNLKLARDVFQRRKNLREKNIGSEVEFLKAQNKVESLESQLATLREQFGNFTIRTSISGRVSQVNIKEGESVSSGRPVFQVANAQALKVKADVSEAYLSTVDEKDSVVVSFSSINEQINGRLDVVNEVIDPSNRTFGIEVVIPSLENKIRPNMLAKLKINDITKRNALVASINNVQQNQGTNYLYRAEKTDSSWVAKRQQVSLGDIYNEHVIITEGLSAGDYIITAGDNGLGDDVPIRIVNN
jgi:RND family efflux transporter MFP subunit